VPEALAREVRVEPDEVERRTERDDDEDDQRDACPRGEARARIGHQPAFNAGAARPAGRAPSSGIIASPMRFRSSRSQTVCQAGAQPPALRDLAGARRPPP
jgi:hypothetical protein